MILADALVAVADEDIEAVDCGRGYTLERLAAQHRKRHSPLRRGSLMYPFCAEKTRCLGGGRQRVDFKLGGELGTAIAWEGGDGRHL